MAFYFRFSEILSQNLRRKQGELTRAPSVQHWSHTYAHTVQAHQYTHKPTQTNIPHTHKNRKLTVKS